MKVVIKGNYGGLQLITGVVYELIETGFHEGGNSGFSTILGHSRLRVLHGLLVFWKVSDKYTV